MPNLSTTKDNTDKKPSRTAEAIIPAIPLKPNDIQENNNEWDYDMKYINLTMDTMKNQTTEYSPFELTGN